MGSIRVSVCYHSSNFDRGKYLKSVLRELDTNWIEDYSPSQILDYWCENEKIDNWWSNSLSKINRFFTFIQIFYVQHNIINKFIFSIKYLLNSDSFLGKTPIGQLSLMLKHDKAIRDFHNSKHDFLLVLEDDAVVHKNTFKDLECLSKKLLNREFESPMFLDISEGAKITLPWWKIFLNNNKFTTKIRWGFCRTTCGYIVDRSFADLWVEENREYDFPSNFVGSDFYITAFLYLFKINVYFTIKPIFLHGSENGTWVSNFIKN